MKLPFKTVAIAAALSALSLQAAAQAFIEIDTVPNVIGIGVGSVPDYRGSDDYQGAVAPFFRYQLPGTQRYVQLNATELTLNLLNSREFRFGPMLNYHFGRDDDIDDEVVKRMRPIDDTVEAGVFGEIVWTEQGNPRNRFILGATLYQDIGSESDGFRARINARYWRQVSQALDLHIGGGIYYGSTDYNNHYFGVNRENVGTSRLPFYSAGSGVNEYYLTLGGLYYMSREWLLAGGVRLSQLSGDAKDSPIVSQRGDKSQVIAGIGIAYMWR